MVAEFCLRLSEEQLSQYAALTPLPAPARKDPSAAMQTCTMTRSSFAGAAVARPRSSHVTASCASLAISQGAPKAPAAAGPQVPGVAQATKAWDWVQQKWLGQDNASSGDGPPATGT
mgnify:CR=1 FL=1